MSASLDPLFTLVSPSALAFALAINLLFVGIMTKIVQGAGNKDSTPAAVRSCVDSSEALFRCRKAVERYEVAEMTDARAN